jgi:hypothetical protein
MKTAAVSDRGRKDRYGRKQIAPPYRDLEREWYARLAETGFEDIEVYDNVNNTYLRGHHLEARKRMVRGTQTGTAEEMRLAEEWLDIDAWKTRTERWLWAARVKAGWDYLELADRWPAAVSRAQAIRARFVTRTRHMLEHFTSRLNGNSEDP